MSKDKNKDKNVIEYDLTNAQNVPPENEIEILEKRVFKLEKILRDNDLAHLLEQTMSDEEYICVKTIDTVKKLVSSEIATKDDINMFDVVYRNLNTIRGIQPTKGKKEKPKSREELISLIKTNKGS